MSAWDTRRGEDFMDVVPQLLQEMLQQQKKQNDLLARMIGETGVLRVDNRYELGPDRQTDIDPSTLPAANHEIKMLDFINATITPLDENSCVMTWDGGRDYQGDEFTYTCEWTFDNTPLCKAHEKFVFSKVFEDDTVYVQLSIKDKAAIIGKMIELIQNGWR